MIVGIILIVVAFIILSPIMIVLIKGLCNAIYMACRYGEVDEVYGVAVIVGSLLLAAGMACVFKYHKPEPKETQTIQQEVSNDQIGSQEAQIVTEEES